MTLTPEPPLDCPLCPRLVSFHEGNRKAHEDWFNAPVPSFGPGSARFLIVGLAPGLQGANRTGRPFTGDHAGDLLYQTLLDFGFAKGSYDARPDDGLTLSDCMITNAVRCVPPQNKPVGAEIKACRSFLVDRISALPNLKIILALGRIAHESVITAFGERKVAHPFVHGKAHELPYELPHEEAGSLTLYDSYHCSRYNTNTRRLTEEMFRAVFADIRKALD